MARNTMRTAFRNWQSLNEKLQAALRELNHQYLALLNKAAIFPMDKNQGLLRLASSSLLHPLDKETRQLHERLAQAFAFLGRGFFQRSPTTLQWDIFQYADRIQEICLRLDHLSQELSLARKIFDILEKDNNITPPYLKLTLYDPKGVWTTLLLQERYRLTRKCFELSRAKSWQAQRGVCQNWLKLLQSSLPPEKLQGLEKIMLEINAATATAVPGSKYPFQQLDLCNDLANRLSFEGISPRCPIT